MFPPKIEMKIKLSVKTFLFLKKDQDTRRYIKSCKCQPVGIKNV